MEMLKVFVKEMGFKQSAIDHSVFYQQSAEEHTIVAIATDDMAVMSKKSRCQKVQVGCTVASKTAPMFAHSSKIQTLYFNEWMNF